MVVPGPGVLNALAGLATAYSANSRVLLLAGQIDSRLIGKGYGALHEIPDQAGILSRLTKWTGTVRRADDIPALVTRAFTELRGGRPRPVALELPTGRSGGELRRRNRGVRGAGPGPAVRCGRRAGRAPAAGGETPAHLRGRRRARGRRIGRADRARRGASGPGRLTRQPTTPPPPESTARTCPASTSTWRPTSATAPACTTGR
jgi:hypothetical protein